MALINHVEWTKTCTLYRMRRENFDIVHRKVDGIEMNIKVPYRLTIFAIIINRDINF